MVYAKNDTTGWKYVRNLLPRGASGLYANPDNDPRGPWTSGDFTAQAGRGTPTQFYTLVTPGGAKLDPPPGRCWLYTEQRYKELVEDGRVWFGDSGNNVPRLKRFLSEVQDGLVPKNLWTADEVGTTGGAKREVQALFPGTSAFATPKPERLLERIIHIATDPGDIVLDVFAGSGTTAAVAQKMGRRWVTCELVEDTFDRFTRPRLEKVVRGEDMGGITVTKGERVDNSADGLPEGLTPKDAQKLTSLLNKAIRDEPELKKSADLRAVKQLVKTKKAPDTINWRGGGGFTVARLSEPCFDVDEDTGTTMLTEHVTAANLARAVAAHLRFTMTPDHPVFAAKRANMYLTVTRQPVTTEFIDEILGYVAEDEAVTVAATSASPEVAEYLAKKCRGSRVIVIPDGLFLTTLSDKA